MIKPRFDWFKYKYKRIGKDAKDITHPVSASICRIPSCHYYYIYTTTKLESCRNRINRSNCRLNFFIQYHITHRDKIKEKRQKHFQRLNEAVFRHLAKRSFPEKDSKILLQESYDNIQLKITSFLYDSEDHEISLALSHLESYGNIIEQLNKVRSMELDLNTKVRDFVSSLDASIIQVIQSTNSAFHESSGLDNDPNTYVLSNIRDYLFRCAQNVPLVLFTQKNEGDIRQSKLLIDQGRNYVAIANNIDLLHVKASLEILRDSTVKRIDNLIQQRNSIIRLYNEQILPTFKNINSIVEEEEPIKGGCDLSYCPKPKLNKLLVNQKS
jgi:hypothetical protein